MKPEEVTQYMAAVTQGLTDLALQLKQPVEQVYGLFLRQNYVKGVIGIVQLLIIFYCTYLFINLIKWGLKKEKKSSSYTNFENNKWISPIILFGGIVLVFSWLIIFFGGFEDLLSRFINPNYMTVKDILELIKH